ncbi:hypothetical protein PSPPH_0783 [Pseudomonas savastanoi pv. phaseolicola 1448A]|uniref:Uncharacterized protein n=1 Tax=Pseudomonas savastanoi pv. phaseolicola (strain 1448A / Race 6) TaxID=264730 RepID=Q48NF4_PSE14|nr:hypothetical protein PSPPH_0783 [Pseudomonas savastanoi pv. phaseolicola 1448A]RMV30874.1 hypothetical protein ALP12_04541 [Pseudomonas savastanoi pv. phaseolicola]
MPRAWRTSKGDCLCWLENNVAPLGHPQSNQMRADLACWESSKGNQK